jgi:tetratricopeptide (TPR) repeat protein
MRRVLFAITFLALLAAAGAVVVTVIGAAREYDRLIAAGDAAVAAEQPFQALEAYSGAIALRPDSMLAHLKRGMTYQRHGELQNALKDLRRATELDPTATRPQELLGDVNMTLGRYDRAAARYEAFLALDDSAPRLHYKLGLARYRGGQIGASIEPLQKAVAREKSLAAAHFLLGLALRDQGDSPAARASLETAVLLEPGLTAPREALIGLYPDGPDRRRAIDQLEALVALDPSKPARLVALGRAYADAGRHEAAVLTLGRAVERFPDSAEAYAALGRVWLEAAEQRRDTVALKKSVEALSTATTHSDAASDAFTDLGRAYVLSGDMQAAERAFQQALQQFPIQPEAYFQLATLAARRGRLPEGRDALARYLALMPEDTRKSKQVVALQERLRRRDSQISGVRGQYLNPDTWRSPA